MYTVFQKAPALIVLLLLILLTGRGQSTDRPTPLREYHLEVSTGNTTVLIFPAGIKAIDRGRNTLLAKPVAGIDNILKVKAASDTLIPTSLHVFTADARVYTFQVSYNASPAQPTWDFSQTAPSSSGPLQFSEGALTAPAIAAICAQLSQSGCNVHRPRSKTIGRTHLQFGGSYLYQGVLFLQLELHNHSAIPYPLHFCRAMVRDRRKGKRTSVMEVEKQLLQQSHLHMQAVDAGSNNTIVLAFPQFTIADSKKLVIEVFEGQGDRHLVLPLKGKHLLRSKPLPSALPFLHPGSLQQQSSIQSLKRDSYGTD
ncbi:DUF4138 domain-containing protein [Chitinophaga filiformis]|uniref:Conjugative transposon protein TraN n=1 Tax=Chitinophaga filiformis TaxID=104663 RepID=A0ABY4HWV7_CHIFI|nr:DUF4138 domain-containing protein [Chitinophaga filiformis]UPK68022.1 conjugative transposon protein TraN [Chitinophaga filiformis]